MAGGDDLQPVEAAFLADMGGGGEIIDNSQDVGLVHGAREPPVKHFTVRRRGNDGKPVARGGVGAPAKMGDLRHQCGAVPVIGV